MPISSENFHYIAVLLNQKAGIKLDTSKDYLVESRLAFLVQELGYHSINQLVEAVKISQNSTLKTKVVEALLTHETLFFRDNLLFESLKETILPEIIESRRSLRQIKIWSCACSTGQEPYSIAMLLCEHFSNLASWHIQIVASDLSQKALKKAKDGLYTQIEIDRGLSLLYRNKYLASSGSHWKIDARLQQMVQFQEINLIESLPNLPQMDLIFLRNVLIYFDPPIREQILQKISTVLASDGFLFLGGAETILGLSSRFKRIQKGHCDCYQFID